MHVGIASKSIGKREKRQKMALTIAKGKTAFLALHFQNDIVHENGKMGDKFSAHVKQTNCLANARKAIEASKKAGVPVIYVTIVHRKGYPEIPPNAGSISKDAGANIEGSWGAQIHEEVKPQSGDLILTNRRQNAFYGTELELILRNKGASTIVLSGVSTNFVIEATARYSYDAGYQTVILRDCCAASSQEMHDFTLDNILPQIGAIISNSGEYIKALG